MSETATEPTDQQPTQPAADTEKDWKVEAEKWQALSRKHEGTAKANAAAAKELAEIKEAGKSEVEKLTDRAAKAEQEAAAVPAKVAAALRSAIVELGIVAKEDEVLLTAADPESLLAQVKRLSERASDRRKNGNHVPKEGSNHPNPPTGDLSEFARNLFQKG